MTILLVMEVEALTITRPPTQVTKLLDPECQVPHHDPGNTSPQPRYTRNAHRKGFLKYFPRISLRQVQSNDSTSSSQMGNGALQQDQRVRRPPQGRRQDEENTSNRIEPSQRDGYLDGQQIPSEEIRYTGVQQLPPAQLNGRKAILNLLFWKRLKQTRNQGESVADIVAIKPKQPLMNAADVQNIIISDEASRAITATRIEDEIAEEPPIVSDSASQTPPVLSVLGETTTHNEEAAELIPDTETISIDSPKLFSPEKGVFVGHLFDIPPPERLELEWRPIRAKLVKNIKKAVQTLPPSVSGPQRTFEPELCMSGQARPGLQNVTLRPTIWIRCGSQQCQRVVQGALTDLSYTRRFPVHVTQYAPRPASSDPEEHTMENDLSLSVAHDEISPHSETSISNRAGPADMFTQIGDNDFMIRVQSFASNRGSACGLTVEFRHHPSGRLYTCKLGGLVCIDDQIFGLTTAHALCSRHSLGISAGESFSSTTHLTYGPLEEEDSTDTSEPTEHESWIPAKLWAARYGVSPQPSESGTSQASSPTSEDNYDFALLQIDISADVLPMNGYFRGRNIPQHVVRHSSYLKGRSVSLVCSYEDVRPGQLLDGYRVFVDESGCWETRKIQLQTPLGAGASGTWVVDGPALLGIVIAVYDDEPYVHMLPIASVFSGIQAIASKESKRSYVRVADARTLRMHKQNARQVQSLKKLSEASKPDKTLEIRKISEPESIGQPKPQAASDTEQDAGEPPKEVDHANDRESTNNHDTDIPPKLPWRTFLTLCFLVFAIGIDSSAFPVIMPAITDTFNSIKLIGWYGSAYPLVVGTTFPNFTRLYGLLSRMKEIPHHRTLFLASVLALDAGLVCCLLAPDSAVMLLGRSLCGLGSAGSISGIAFYFTEMLPKEPKLHRPRIGVLLIMYALSRFLGPLVAAVMLDRLHSEDAWRRVFIFHSAVMAVPTILVLLPFIQIYVVRWKYRKAIHRTRSQPSSSTQDPMTTRSDWFCFLKKDVAAFISSSGALICLELGLYYGATLAWPKILVVSLLVFGTGVCLIFFIVNQIWNASLAIVSLRDLNHRNLAFSLCSVFLWGASYHAFIHYLPLWLRIVRDSSPLRVGVTYLPTAATYLFACIFILSQHRISEDLQILYSLAGSIVSLVFMALGAGLMSRFNSGTSTSELLGLQILFSVGAGIGGFQSISTYFHYPSDAVRYTSDDFKRQWPNLMMFTEMMGGFVGISAAQTVFWTQLSRGVKSQEPALQVILQSGASKFKERLGKELQNKAVEVFNNALTRTFFVSTAAGASLHAIGAAAIVLAAAVIILFFPCIWLIVRRRKRNAEQPRPPRLDYQAPFLQVAQPTMSPQNYPQPMLKYEAKPPSLHYSISPHQAHSAELSSSIPTYVAPQGIGYSPGQGLNTFR